MRRATFSTAAKRTVTATTSTAATTMAAVWSKTPKDASSWCRGAFFLERSFTVRTLSGRCAALTLVMAAEGWCLISFAAPSREGQPTLRPRRSTLRQARSMNRAVRCYDDHGGRSRLTAPPAVRGQSSDRFQWCSTSLFPRRGTPPAPASTCVRRTRSQTAWPPQLQACKNTQARGQSATLALIGSPSVWKMNAWQILQRIDRSLQIQLRLEVRRVVGTAHQRGAGNVAEALVAGDLLVVLKGVRVDVFDHRQVLRGRA